MKRLILITFILFLLVACGGTVDEESIPAEQPATVSSNDSSNEPSSEPPATEKPTIDSSSKTEEKSETPAETEPSVEIGTTPAEAGIIRDSDWKIGSDDPSVVLIEYGDFQ